MFVKISKEAKQDFEKGDSNNNNKTIISSSCQYSSDDDDNNMEASSTITGSASKQDQLQPQSSQPLESSEVHEQATNAEPLDTFSPQPSAGPCRIHPCHDCSSPYIRTLYSKFPKDHFRLALLHFSMILSVFFIYPILNLFWSFYLCETPDVIAMFYRITGRASANHGILDHLRGLEWFTWPPLFISEIFAVLIAVIIKDCVHLSWEEKSAENSSLCSLIEDHVIKQRKWPCRKI